ncbi:MAG: hypothetical protein ACKO34_07045 [Vampirovibrionales bacterium]
MMMLASQPPFSSSSSSSHSAEVPRSLTQAATLGLGNRKHKPSVANAGHPQQFMTIEQDNKARNLKVMQRKIEVIAGHMTHQLSEHEMAMENTKRVFEQLLEELPRIASTFSKAFEKRTLNGSRIYHEVDSDKSIAMLNILWHTLTFTTRANIKPLALFRQGNAPLFTGRILAIRGDFQEINYQYETERFTDLLPFELASLFIPASPYEPAILKVPHTGGEEQYIQQSDACDVFLMHCIEMVCGGGFLHEE